MPETILTVGPIECCDGKFKVGKIRSPQFSSILMDCPSCGQRYEICPLPDSGEPTP